MKNQSHVTSPLRADIQALRAFAVTAVVVNHLWPSSFRGGYIGVDIFFVISGFLITQHLKKELVREGKIKLARFYARRIKRLLPAALTVSSLSFLFSLILIPADSWGKVIREFFASSAYIQNWALAADATNYFAQDSATTAFQHYWSLSVEEQFYIFWPLLLTGIYLWTRSQRILLLALSVFGLGSFAYAQFLVSYGINSAYFNTFTRAWEFAVGGLTALLLLSVSPSLLYLRRLLQVIAWSVLLGTVFFLSSNAAVPGYASLPAVLATAVIIGSGPQTYAPLLHKVASSRFVQFVGAISYSLYLWHWPLIVLLPNALEHRLTNGEKLAVILLSGLLAFVTKKLVEDRIRVLPAVRGALLGAALSLVLIGTMAFSAHLSAAYFVQQQRSISAATIGELPITLEAARSTSTCLGAYSLYNKNCAPDFTTEPLVTAGSPDETPWGGIEELCETLDRRDMPGDMARSHAVCDFSEGNSNAQVVWVIGDSHSQQWRHAMIPYAREKGWKLNYWTHGGCPTWETPMSLKNAGESDTPHTPALRDECLSWAKETKERLALEKPDVLFIGNYSSAEKIDAGVSGDMLSQYTAAIKKDIESFAGDSQVVFYRDTPIAGTVVGAECVNISGTGCSAPVNNVLLQDPQAETAENLGYPVIDMTAMLCPEETCRGVVGGIPVFYDSNHISRTYVKTLALPLAQQLDKVLE